MKIEHIGDVTLLTTEDGREFYVPGHIEIGTELYVYEENPQKDVSPRVILSGTRYEMSEAAKHFCSDACDIVDRDDPRTAFFALCETHLAQARKKHPKFAKVISPLNRIVHEGFINNFRKTQTLNIDDSPSVYNILREEVEEFMLELLHGDLARAREEAADIVAVLLRALEGDIKQENQQ